MSVPISPIIEDDECDTLSIVVMGPTGTGKTSFINLLSGSHLTTGDSLESCTNAVQLSQPFEFNGRMITLIDTPGFDDTNMRDSDVLQMVAAYLAFSENEGRKIAGILYLHRILDNRMGGISARNFKLFRNLCGDAALRNVVIVTTMWDKVEEYVGEAREKELASKDVFFKPVLEKGAQLARHTNTLESAQRILLSVIDHPSAIKLQIQRELKSGVDISKTVAGVELKDSITQQVATHQKELRILVDEIREAARMRDEETKKELIGEKAKLEGMVSKLQSDMETLSEKYQQSLATFEQRFSSPNSQAYLKAEGLPAYPFRTMAEAESNAVVEGKLMAAFPVVGLWGKLSVMLSPFSLTWR